MLLLNRSRIQRCLLSAMGFAGLLAAAIALRLHPDIFDRAVARAANRLAAPASATSQLADLITYPSLQGVAVVSLACGCWFTGRSAGSRERLVRGCVAAVLAAAAAHFVQDSLPPVLKPIYDPGSQVRVPEVLGEIEWLRANSNPNSQSFPSERATLFAGVAIAVFAANRRIGSIALAVTAVTELCRIYLGLHYPSDILGSFFLAATIYWLVETTLLFGLDNVVIEWERSSPATFYGVAFAGCYGLATAFEDLRHLLAQLPN
jgi:membrane-associated phospholipid phosphatase